VILVPTVLGLVSILLSLISGLWYVSCRCVVIVIALLPSPNDRTGERVPMRWRFNSVWRGWRGRERTRYAPVSLDFCLPSVARLLDLLHGRCRFAYLPPNPFNDINAKSDNIQRYLQGGGGGGGNLDNLQLGAYFRRNQGVAYTFDSCVPYSFEIWDGADSYWRTAIVTYPIGWFVAFLLNFCLFISIWCAFPRAAYRIIGYMFVLVCVPCQALAYLILSSNLCRNNPQLAHADATGNSTSVQDLYQDYCRLGTGGYLGIGALAGYLVTGTLCCCLKPRCLNYAGASEPKPQTAPPPQQQQQPVPPAGLPPNASMSAASQQSRPLAGGLPPTTGSVSTQPTSFDEEYGNGGGGGGAYPAAVVVGAAGAGAVAAGAYYGARARQRPSQLVAAQKTTMIPPHRMSYQEQRDLYSAVGHGAAVGAHAGPDTVYDIPSVIVPIQPQTQHPQHPRPAPAPVRPQDQRDLFVAAAAGAAVGARARADTSPEGPMDVPLEVEVIAETAKGDDDDDDDDIPDDLDDDENDLDGDDDAGTLPSAPVDLDEQDDLYVAVAVGSEEGARARTDTLPAVDEPDNDNNNEDDDNSNGDDLYAHLALAASRSHEAPGEVSSKPDPPSSLEVVGADTVPEDSASSLVDDPDNEGETNDEASMQVAAATMMMGDIDQSAEAASDSDDGELRRGGESDIDPEPEDIEQSDNRSTHSSDRNSYDDSRTEHDNDYYQGQDEDAFDEKLPAESSLDVAEDSAVAEEPQGDEQGFGGAAPARSNSTRSDRQDEPSSLDSRGSRRRQVEESGPHDESVFM
jgi:hypothetical protein